MNKVSKSQVKDLFIPIFRKQTLIYGLNGYYILGITL